MSPVIILISIVLFAYILTMTINSYIEWSGGKIKIIKEHFNLLKNGVYQYDGRDLDDDDYIFRTSTAFIMFYRECVNVSEVFNILNKSIISFFFNPISYYWCKKYWKWFKRNKNLLTVNGNRIEEVKNKQPKTFIKF